MHFFVSGTFLDINNKNLNKPLWDWVLSIPSNASLAVVLAGSG